MALVSVVHLRHVSLVPTEQMENMSKVYKRIIIPPCDIHCLLYFCSYYIFLLCSLVFFIYKSSAYSIWQAWITLIAEKLEATLSKFRSTSTSVQNKIWSKPLGGQLRLLLDKTDLFRWPQFCIINIQNAWFRHSLEAIWFSTLLAATQDSSQPQCRPTV